MVGGFLAAGAAWCDVPNYEPMSVCESALAMRCGALYHVQVPYFMLFPLVDGLRLAVKSSRRRAEA